MELATCGARLLLQIEHQCGGAIPVDTKAPGFNGDPGVLLHLPGQGVGHLLCHRVQLQQPWTSATQAAVYVYNCLKQKSRVATKSPPALDGPTWAVIIVFFVC